MTSIEPPSDDIAQQVFLLLRARTEHDIRLEDSLALLDIDSVATAELSLEIEKSFQVRVDEEIMDVRTVGELIDYVRERCRAASRARGKA